VIRYTKEARANAARRGKDLFTLGYAEATGKGRGEFQGPMAWDMGNALFAFAYAVYSGTSPREAFDQITWPEHPK
jgi:hypothetical protein